MRDDKIKREYKKWCCWELDEEEILHVYGELFDTKFPDGLITDNEMEEIVEDFKDRISIAFEDWEDILKEIIIGKVCKK